MSMRTVRFDLFKNSNPAFRWTLQSSPSALIMPFPKFCCQVTPSLSDHTVALTHMNQNNIRHLPKRSHERSLKKPPLLKIPSFFRTNSTFFGSFITTPGGNEGTEISNVSNPNWRSHFTNQVNNSWRGLRKWIPLPTNGSVLGGRLWTVSYTSNFGKDVLGERA